MSVEDELRFPIGRFTPRPRYSRREVATAIGTLAQTPSALGSALDALTEAQLDTPYRPGGWTVRQVAHHIADSQMNGYVRIRLALTETRPMIRVYDENGWSELADCSSDVHLSVDLLAALTRRWVLLLRALDDSSLRRTYLHPDDGELSVAAAIDLYAWHGRHHVAHIMSLRRRRGW